VARHLPTPLPADRCRLIGGLLHQAQQYGPIREDALADIGLAWPTLRRDLRELGRRLVEASAIADVNDVFWLRLAEGRAFATALDTAAAVCAASVKRRPSVG